MRILVVEDHPPLRIALVTGLTEAGFAVDAAADGETGWWHARDTSYDVIILDLMLPGCDGITVLNRLRQAGSTAHVLLLTARDGLDDRVRGLDAGADDYLIKPFAFAELLARVRALVRRSYQVKHPHLRRHGLDIDTGRRQVTLNGNDLALTPREFALFEYLALRTGEVVTREDMRQHLHPFASESGSNIIDVYIGYVRRKLEAVGLTGVIQTRRGEGYLLIADCGPDRPADATADNVEKTGSGTNAGTRA